MDVSFSFASEPPARDMFHPLLVDYYATMIPLNPPKIAALFDAQEIANSFWDEVQEYLPPSGRLVLARNEDSVLIGGAMLRTLRPGVGEFKRLFVRPEGRGLGLGRKLIEIRLQAAREMGLHTVLADTLRKTTAMQSLYKEFGFRRIDRYPESHAAVNFPAMEAELLYFQLDL